MIVPVIAKAKIGRNLAYPIGWESLNPLFEGLPQATKSSIAFFSRLGHASHFNATLRDGEPYNILTCHISSEGNTIADVDKYQNISWQVRIYPVLRERKAVAAEALIAQALPALRDFLLKTYLNDGTHPTKRPGYFAARFWPDEDRIELFPQALNHS